MEHHKNIASLLQSMNIGELQQCDDFHILKFEDHLDRIPYQTLSRKCEFFQVYFSRQYNVDLVIDDLSFSIKDKAIISFLTPLQTLSVDVKSVESISNGYMLAFEPSFLKEGLSDFDLQQRFPYFNLNYSPFHLLEENLSGFKELFDKLIILFKNASEENIEIARSYLNILLLEARKSFFDGTLKNNLQSRAKQIAFSFESLIRKHAHSRNSLDFYADKLNISTVYLSECIKKACGKTAKQIIHEYTVLEASTLLIQTSDSIDQIADKLGFSASSNFVSFFKKHTGYTPSRFRTLKKHSFQ